MLPELANFLGFSPPRRFFRPVSLPQIEQVARMLNFIEPQPSLIALYGSYSRGRVRLDGTDIDMLVVVDFESASPRPHPATPQSDVKWLRQRKKEAILAGFPEPVLPLYVHLICRLDLLVLTSDELRSLQVASDWLGEEVRTAVGDEQRVIFRDGQLVRGWNNYRLMPNTSPRRPISEYGPLDKAKLTPPTALFRV